jgi:hypothetical protein
LVKPVTRIVDVRKDDLRPTSRQFVKLFLPVAICEFIIHEDETVRAELMTPADDDLAVNQTFVDPT